MGHLRRSGACAPRAAGLPAPDETYGDVMPKDATGRTDAVAQTASGAGLLVSCLPMVAMLPGFAGSVLGVVGLGASSAVVSRVAPGHG